MIIRIADLDINWNLENTDFVSGFTLKNENAAHPVLSISDNTKMGECHGIQFVQTPSDHVLRRASVFHETMYADKDWNLANIYCKNYQDDHFTLPLVAICSRFASFDTLLLHGSLVEYKGDGIVFTGYSGTGKTTQAELWNKYLDANIINGDKLFIRKFDNKIFAYGLPWKGSSPYCLNEKALVKAVIVLRQAKENNMKKLNLSECIEYFMPHIFLPHWDEIAMHKVLDTFDSVIENVPVWLLECRPDEDAVKLARNMVL